MEYRNVLENEEIRGERLTEEDWKRIETNIVTLNEYCRSRQITLVLLPVQMKFSIYPEYMPSGKISRPKKTAFYRLLALLDKLSQVQYVDVRTALLAAKEKYPVFIKRIFIGMK